jgi:hypothetical protein
VRSFRRGFERIGVTDLMKRRASRMAKHVQIGSDAHPPVGITSRMIEIELRIVALPN